MKTPCSIEPLEARIAPAILATYTDVDGDLVSVKISKGNPGDATLVFNPGPAGAFGDQLATLNLNGNQQVFHGASITITAKPQLIGGVLRGDGLAQVGLIDASGGGGIDLGAVTVKGDLDEILAGDATLTTTGLASLSVASLGRFDNAPFKYTLINGALGSLKVTGDVNQALVHAIGGANGKIGSVTIGGSLIGGTFTDSGTIHSDGDMGMVKIGGDIRGSSGSGGGEIICQNLAGLTIGGSVYGGTIAGAGAISVAGSAGAIKIGGSLVGSFANFSGAITAGNVTSLTIAGSVFGNSGTSSGAIQLDQIGSLKIGGSVIGGSMTDSASIVIIGDAGSVKIGGNLTGGGGVHSAQLFVHGALGSLSVGGSIVGGAGGDRDNIIGGTIEGQVIGIAGIGSVKIGGSVTGGDGSATGQIRSYGKLGSVTIGGALTGGVGDWSGLIVSTGDLRMVKIGGDVTGSGSAFTGVIRSGGKLAGISISGGLTGGSGGNSGEILSTGDLGTVKIGGSLRGGSILSAASSLDSSGYIEGARIASVFIGGSVIPGGDSSNSGSLIRNASIRAVDDLGSITVLGSLVGTNQSDGDATDGNVTSVIISARGQRGLSTTATTDVALKSLTVGGRVDNAVIYAGYDRDLVGKNADAQIGKVTVGGDWIASNLIAGVAAGANGFGNGDDVKLSGAGVKDNADASGAISRIASVIIKGTAAGTLAAGDAAVFGIEAQRLGAIKLGGAAVALRAGAANDLFANRHILGPTLGTGDVDGYDFHAFEVPLT